MSASSSRDNEFLDKITELTETNLTNSQFGVSMLAREMRMSRSTLHRKVHSITKITVSQFINQLRLNHAMEMLRHTSFTVSEIAYKVGFNNVSYFIKCFHEYYGYSPGEVGERENDEHALTTPGQINKKRRTILFVSATTLVILVLVLLLVFKPFSSIKNRIDSIVVLPFLNFTGQDSIEWILSGMQSDLIDELGKINSLFVPEVITSRVFKDSNKTLKEITSELHVDAALQLAVLSMGKNLIRFQPKLIKPGKKEKLLWSTDYKVAGNQILNLYRTIAKQIAKEVNVELTSEEERIVSKSITVDWEVYMDYLKGYDYLIDLRPDSLLKAMDYLNSAIEKDPDWAPPYVALGQIWMWIWRNGKSSESAASKIYENLNNALELDPDLADTHQLIGTVAREIEWDWKRAENEFKKALEINSNHAMSHLGYSILLYELQRPGEANIHAEQGYKLDALNPYIQSVYANALLCKRDYTTAFSFLDSLLTINPNNNINNGLIENAAYATGNFMRMFEASKKIFRKVDMEKCEKTYNERGYIAAYTEIVQQMELLASKGIVSHNRWKYLYYIINRDEKVIELFEKAAETHTSAMEYLGLEYLGTGFFDYSRLYDNPRFIAILNKMNLPLPKTD